MRLKERGQRQFFSKGFNRLVRVESGSVGGQLEEDAVGFAEIKAAEIKPIDWSARGHAEFSQPLLPLVILFERRHPESDMMHPSRARFRGLQIRLNRDV